MDNLHYNRIKAVLAEKDKTGTWLSEQMGRNIGTVSRWMTNRSPDCILTVIPVPSSTGMDTGIMITA